MTQDAAQARKGGGLSVAGWPLQRKIAALLAIPLLLAATLAGLRVQSDLSDSRQAGTSAKQVTVIQPAVDYLTAAEAAMVAAQSDNAASQGDLIDSIDDINTAAETLVQARDSADLDDIQVAHVNALLDLSQAMRATPLSQSASQELFSERGGEGPPIDRLAGAVEGGEKQPAPLRTANAR